MIIKELDNLKQITAESGFVITEWIEDPTNPDSILDFTYSRIIYAPLSVDTSMYYEITDEAKDELEARQMQKLMENESRK